MDEDEDVMESRDRTQAVTDATSATFPLVGVGAGWLLLSYLCGTIFYLVTKYSLQMVSFGTFLFMWYGVALVFHIAHSTVSKRTSPIRISRSNMLYMGIYTILDIASTVTAFLALSILDPSIASFFEQSQILFTMMLGFLLLREQLIRQEIVAATVIITGIVLMCYRSGEVPPAGAALILFSNLLGSANLIIVRKVSPEVGPYTFARFRTAMLFLVFSFYLLYESGGFILPSLKVTAFLVMGSFFGPFLNTISLYKCLEYIPAGKVALFRSVQPLLVMAATGAILGMLPGPRETAGGLVVIAGCIMLAYYHARHMVGQRFPLRTPEG